MIYILRSIHVNDIHSKIYSSQVAKSWFPNFLLARLVFYGQPGQIYVKLGSILPEAKWHMVAAQQSQLCVPQRERPPNFIISYIYVRQKWHFSAVKFMCVTVEVISATFCILFHLCCKLVPSLTRMVSIGLIIIIVWSTGWSLIALHWLVLKYTKLNTSSGQQYCMMFITSIFIPSGRKKGLGWCAAIISQKLLISISL